MSRRGLLALAIAAVSAACAHGDAGLGTRPCAPLVITCPPPLPLPGCAPGHVGLAVADVVARAAQLQGQRVAVDGPLRRGVQRLTEQRCAPPGPCCNRVTAGLALGEVGAPLDKLVHVGGEADRPSFGCDGDQRGQCCTVPVDGHRAVALGTLRVEDGRVRLDDALVCTPGL